MTRKIELRIAAQREITLRLALNNAEFAFHPQFGVQYLPQGGHGPIQTDNVQVTKTELNLKYGPSGNVVFRFGLVVPRGIHQISLHSDISAGGTLDLQIENANGFVQNGSQSPAIDRILDIP